MSAIKVICTPALAPACHELIPEFERAFGHKVVITYGTARAIKDSLLDDGFADVAISTDSVIDDLAQRGRIIPGSRIDVATVGIGLQVRKGALKPDLRSSAALKQALLAATSIGYIDPASGAAAGIHIDRVIRQLGIACDVNSRTRLVGGGALVNAVAGGEVEIGLAPISEIVSDARVELVGPLPLEFQEITLLAASLVKGSKEPEAAKSLLQFFETPFANSVLRNKGLEPS